MLDQANNGARERKGLNLRDDILRPRMAIISNLLTQKVGAFLGKLMTGMRIGSERNNLLFCFVGSEEDLDGPFEDSNDAAPV
jgi:hypothetical protein